MIRVWSTNTGTEIEAYSAPVEGSRRLAMSAAGTKIVSASPTGSIQIWKTEQPPCDTDIKFHVDENDVSCLSFSPDEQKLLICLEDEVQIWNWEARQKLGQVQSFWRPRHEFQLRRAVHHRRKQIADYCLGCHSARPGVRQCRYSGADNVILRRQECDTDMWPISSPKVAFLFQEFRVHFVPSTTRLLCNRAHGGQYF